MPTNDKDPATDELAEPVKSAAAGTPVSTEPAEPRRRAIGGLLVAYAVGRLAVFAGLVLICYLLGLRGLPGLLAGAVLSIPVSFFLLTRTRVELARRIAERKSAELGRKDAFRTAGTDG